MAEAERRGLRLSPSVTGSTEPHAAAGGRGESPVLRGGARLLWDSTDFEAILSGPAETGKTWACLSLVHHYLTEYPGAQGVLVRKTYSSLVSSALGTYKRIIGERPGEPAPPGAPRGYGGEKPEWYDYPNGSRLWLAGFDNPGKALSSERDFICGNQVEELTLDDWEVLTTRCTGRGAVMPFTRIFGDCNPGQPSHWIKQRQGLRLLESRHEDNPTLFDDAGQVTPQGVKTLSVLDNLTGARKERLRYGRWVQAEGVVYEGWDRAVHVIDSFPIPDSWRRIRVVDFGFTNPFVCGWLAVDPDGRIILYRELYRTQRIVKDHAKEIRRLSEGERIETTVCDHDAEDRATLEAEGIPTTQAFKLISPGIQAVQERLKKAGDGKPRLFVFGDALTERDEELERKRFPVCTEQEMEVYSWPKGADGKPVKEVPVDVHNHGCDMLRYGVAYADGLGRIDLGPGTW